MPRQTKLDAFIDAFGDFLESSRDTARDARDNAREHGWKGDTDRHSIEASVFDQLLEAWNAAAREAKVKR